MKPISLPLNARQRGRLLAVTDQWLERAREQYGASLPTVEVRFDLRGATAGQYRTHPTPLIRYNAELAAAQFQMFCARTPPHEVAHHVVAHLYGTRGVKPHGPQWRAVMEAFGLEPSRCHDYDLGQVRVRRQRRFTYRCGCREHALSATRHNRVLRGVQRYYCRACGKRLEQLDT